MRGARPQGKCDFAKSEQVQNEGRSSFFRMALKPLNKLKPALDTRDGEGKFKD